MQILRHGNANARQRHALAGLVLLITLMGLGACSKEKSDPLDTIDVTVESASSSGDTEGVDSGDSEVATEDATESGEAPAELIEAVKASTGVDDSIAACAAQTLVDQFDVEKATAIAALPATETSDDRVALDQAVLDCRG
jgi:hypothetical protein